MFGEIYPVDTHTLVEKVDFQVQPDASYKTTNNKQVAILDTPMARVYINRDTYFTNVPESVWNASFEGEPSPKQFLEERIGDILDGQDITNFQKLLSDLLNAEFAAKNEKYE